MAKFQTIAVPATRSSAAVLQAKRRAVLVMLTFCVLSGLLGLGVAAAAFRAANNVVAPVEPTRYIAVAEEAALDWLRGRSSNVPAAVGLDTDWSVDADGVPVTERLPVALSSLTYSGRARYTLGDRRPMTVHLIRFRVTYAGWPYYVDVPVAETATGPVLAETPVLLPAPFGEQATSEPIDYSDMYADAGDVPANVRASVEDWAATFAAADIAGDEELREVTQSQDPNQTFAGLGKWTGRVESIVSAVPVGGPEDPTRRQGWVVQARVVLALDGANSPSLRSTYDVYVVTEGADADPPVVDWGPAGSAADLKDITTN